MKILVVTEQRQGKWNNASFETVAAAQQIAKDTSSTVSGLVIGKGVFHGFETGDSELRFLSVQSPPILDERTGRLDLEPENS